MYAESCSIHGKVQARAELPVQLFLQGELAVSCELAVQHFHRNYSNVVHWRSTKTAVPIMTPHAGALRPSSELRVNPNEFERTDVGHP